MLNSETDTLCKYCARLCRYLIRDMAQTGNISTAFGSHFEGKTRSYLVSTPQDTQSISYKFNLANTMQRKILMFISVQHNPYLKLIK